uniref:Uncharacterized protein n=1 Tax=Knipowitschia caucasica TaxID=637954 RepID=A0AAV2KVU0_KNICA
MIFVQRKLTPAVDSAQGPRPSGPKDLRNPSDLSPKTFRAQDLRNQTSGPNTSGPRPQGPKTLRAPYLGPQRPRTQASGPRPQGPRPQGPKTSGPKTSGPKTLRAQDQQAHKTSGPRPSERHKGLSDSLFMKP